MIAVKPTKYTKLQMKLLETRIGLVPYMFERSNRKVFFCGRMKNMYFVKSREFIKEIIEYIVLALYTY